MYSQFCYHYQKYSEKKRASMHVPRKPGEQLEVDWAGQTAALVDHDTGEIVPAYVFVGVLSYSQYAYVESFLSMNLESWINAHVNMYRYFGGSTWIIAALRNQKFFTLAELNQEIKVKLDEYNKRPFQKKDGSRLSIFLGEEKPLLISLPAAPFELAEWKQATVQFNYHIAVDKMHYSVPYEYIKQKVDIRLTRNMVEVFYHNNRICSHKRLYGQLVNIAPLKAICLRNIKNIFSGTVSVS